MLYNVLWTSWHCLFAYLFERVSFHSFTKSSLGCECRVFLQVPHPLQGRSDLLLLLHLSLLEVDHPGSLAWRCHLFRSPAGKDYLDLCTQSSLGPSQPDQHSRPGARSLVRHDHGLHCDPAHRHIQALYRDCLLESGLPLRRPCLLPPLLPDAYWLQHERDLNYFPAAAQPRALPHVELRTLLDPHRCPALLRADARPHYHPVPARDFQEPG